MLPDLEEPDVSQQTLVNSLPRELTLFKGDARGIFTDINEANKV
jgi:hypothetical protein